MTLPANKHQSTSRAWWLLGIVLVIVCWCANPWQLYFLNDDFIHIPKALNGVLGHHHSLRHVGDFSLYLDSLFSQKSAVGYHFTNLLLHLGNTVLVVFVLLSISHTLQSAFTKLEAILTAALFGIYAFHSEAIYWIIGRSASLSFFFTMLCWLCFHKALQQRVWLLPMVLFFGAGIFTYEAVWVFPLWLIVWYFLLPLGSMYRSLAQLPVAVIWVLFICYFPVRYRVTGEWLGSYEAHDLQQLQILPVFQKTVFLFARSFLPPVYGHKWFLFSFAFVIALLVILGRWLWRYEKNNRLLWFWLIAWLVSYLPYISLGISTTGYESERYLYFPSLFLCAFLVNAFVRVGKRNRPVSRWLLAGVFVYQLFFFVKASLAFRTISNYAKQGIEAVGSIPAKKRLFIKNLPAYSYGFPVFNFGFTEAVAWMIPKRDSGTTTVLNKTDFRKEKISVATHESAVADTLVFYTK